MSESTALSFMLKPDAARRLGPLIDRFLALPGGWLKGGVAAVPSGIGEIVFDLSATYGLILAFGLSHDNLIIDPMPLIHTAVLANFVAEKVCPKILEQIEIVNQYEPTTDLHKVYAMCEAFTTAAIIRMRVWAADIILAPAFVNVNLHNPANAVEQECVDWLYKKVSRQNFIDEQFDAMIARQQEINPTWLAVLDRFGSEQDFLPEYRAMTPRWLRREFLNGVEK